MCASPGQSYAGYTHGITHLPDLLISFIVVQSARDETLVQIAGVVKAAAGAARGVLEAAAAAAGWG